MLHTLPKDLLVKLIETLQKDYKYLIVYREEDGERAVTICDDDEDFKLFLFVELCSNFRKKTFGNNKYNDTVKFEQFTLEELFSDISSISTRNEYKIIKGKILLE